MPATILQITAEPVDDLRCKFILDRPVAPTGVRKYTSMEEADESPVAAAVLGVPAICEVVLSGNVITAVQDGSLPWSAVEPQVRYAVQTSVTEAEAVEEVGVAGNDDEEFDIVEEIFRSQINPAVAQHGGKVELIDVQDWVVILRMMGGCQGCGMADVTLKQGIEATLKRTLPSIKGIKDVTDHSSGSNPYFQPSKK